MDARDVFNVFGNNGGAYSHIRGQVVEISGTPYAVGLCQETTNNLLHDGYIYHSIMVRTWDPDLISLLSGNCQVERHGAGSCYAPRPSRRTFPIYRNGDTYGAYSEGGSYRGRLIYTQDQLVVSLFHLFQNRGGVSLSPGSQPRQGFPAWEEIIQMMLHLELKYWQLKMKGPVYILIDKSMRSVPLSISNDQDEVVEFGRSGDFKCLSSLY